METGGNLKNKHEYTKLKEQYSAFVFDSYYVEMIEDKLMLHFHYIIENNLGEDIHFHHRVSYAWYQNQNEAINSISVDGYDGLIFHIGLMESINYFKTICPQRYRIKCGRINGDQKKWWTKLFYHGLGEFIYLNGMHEEVTEETFVRFCDEDEYDELHEPIDAFVSGNLIPVGGGKDSVVTLEILKNEHEHNLPFVLSPPQASYDCITKAGYETYLLAERFFDKKMIQMNLEGYLNGHVPYSAILGFISILGAAMTGKKYITLSNERSADESSVIGMTYNHQYSKSFEFERDFNDYVDRYLIKDVKYFSLLRRLYEIEIGEQFAKHRSYHDVFRSCNRGKKDNVWCGTCAKCLFVYIILAPYLTLDEVKNIFDKDLLIDSDLLPIFEELIGLKPTKPFECVGTIDEVRWSLKEILRIHYAKIDMHELPVLLSHFVKAVDVASVHEVSSTKIRNEALHNIPERFLEIYGANI